MAESALDNWHLRTNQVVQRVKFAGGVFFGLSGDYLGGNGVLMTSTDGIEWTRRETGTTAALRGVAFGSVISTSGFPQSIYVTVGAGGTILTSTNATNWTLVPTDYSCDLNDVVYAPLSRRFVAGTTRRTADQPNVLLSNDGSSWEGQNFNGGFSGFGPFYTGPITVAGLSLIAIGGDNIIRDVWRSINGGLTWQNVTNSDSSGQGIAYGQGTVLIAGIAGHGSISRNNGVSWSRLTNPFPHDMIGSDVTYGNGWFVVARGSGPGAGRLLSTTDGITWQSNNFSGLMHSVAYGQGTFVLATDRGIYQSDSVQTPRIMTSWRPTPGWLVLTITGELGRQYRVQASTDFVAWSDLESYILTEQTREVWAPAYSDPRPHFYRVVSP